MRFGVLGPLTVWTDDGAVVPVPGAKVRALLADLLVDPGQPVSADRLVDDIWAEDPPGNPAGTLAAKASQLRRALEDAEPGGRDLVVSPPPGYRLAATDVDSLRFRELLADARAAPGVQDRIRVLTEAVGLWRGPAFADFGDAAFTRAAIAQLEELRLVAVEELAEARLTGGDFRAVAGDLGPVVAAHPLRERLRAAHLRALYGAGRQAEALAGYEDLRRRLADELGVDPSRELVELQRSLLTQDPALVASRPEPVVRKRTSNIPAQRTELVGREADLDELGRAVVDSRLVTLTGPGGVGKTRLALAAAAGSAERFPHGTWLVELAPLQPTGETRRLAEEVAKVLGITDGELSDALADRRMLLVLDNCEHVVDAAAELAEQLLSAAPDLHVLATSREQLRLPGEEVVSVRPLPVPAVGDGFDDLARSQAVRLFVSRARASSREFALDAGNADAVATLCRRLDGIPLALELAATRVRALDVHELVARLDNRFRLLASGHRGAPPRQQTLTALIDWSWELLDDAERTVLRRLAIHQGGCTLEGAESVCAAIGDLDGVLIAEVVARLVDRSLVQQSGRRYRLLESVAAFSLDRLAEAGEVVAAQRTHHAYYLELAERAAPELCGADQLRWLRCLDGEDANLIAALDGFTRAADADAALRLVHALAWYWLLRGRLGEARRRFDAALGLGGSARHRAPVLAWHLAFSFQQGEFTDAAARRADIAVALSELDDPLARAHAELVVALSVLESGTDQDLEVTAQSALSTCRELGDRWGTAALQVVLAKAAHARADVAGLERHATEAARSFAEIGDRWGRLQAAEWLGALAELTGDLGHAADLHREALELAKELEMWGQATIHLCWLGWIAMQRTEYDHARDCCEQVLAADGGDGPGVLFAKVILVYTARREGRLDDAERLARELLAGHSGALFVPIVQVELGYVLELRGAATAAAAEHLAAFDGAQHFEAPRNSAYALGGAAAAATALGEHDVAARLLGAAQALRTNTGMPLLPAERPDIDRASGTARAALGGAAFAAAHAAGEVMAADQSRALIHSIAARGSDR